MEKKGFEKDGTGPRVGHRGENLSSAMKNKERRSRKERGKTRRIERTGRSDGKKNNWEIEVRRTVKQEELERDRTGHRRENTLDEKTNEDCGKKAGG